VLHNEYRIADDNVTNIAKVGRSIWKIENENNNILKIWGDYA
jgi:hypothetical protein